MAKKGSGASGLAAESVSRRGFLKGGAVASVGGAVALAGLGASEAKAAEISWDLEYDVIVVGGGCAGMPAAIAARDHGASVIVVDKNWDVGGRGLLSGGSVQLGCGNRMQQEAGLHDSPDQFFLDWTGSPGQFPVDEKRWGTMGNPLAKYNDRDIIRAFADNAVATFDFLSENGVVWERLGGIRGPGDPALPRQTNARPWPNPSEQVIPNNGGSGLMRPLIRSARNKGVRIMILHRMMKIYREAPDSGRVLGIQVMEVDRWNESVGRPPLNIRALKGVIVATGGGTGNVNFRRIWDPRLTEEYSVWGDAYTTKDADGELAAMAIGASLWTAGSQTNEGDRQVDRAGGQIGTRRNGSPHIPVESTTFFKQGATGLSVGDWQNAIMVKETGRRYYEETLDGKPLGSPGWRDAITASLQWTGDPAKLNGGGPIWAIFDSAAAEREGWNTEPPNVDRIGGFFFSADTLEELAAQLTRNPYQWRAMPGQALAAEVARYNSFVDTGVDTDFGKPTPLHKIEKPPFHAAWATNVLHDVFSGLRINANAQVSDARGQIIPGLYAAGEVASGIAMHGLAKSALFGRLAGIHATNGSA